MGAAVKFDTTINVTTAIAVIGLLGTIGVSYADGKSAIAKQELRIDNAEKTLTDLRRETREDLREIREDQKRILQAVQK
jgi:hypothetical protein